MASAWSQLAESSVSRWRGDERGGQHADWPFDEMVTATYWQAQNIHGFAGTLEDWRAELAALVGAPVPAPTLTKPTMPQAQVTTPAKVEPPSTPTPVSASASAPMTSDDDIEAWLGEL